MAKSQLTVKIIESLKLGPQPRLRDIVKAVEAMYGKAIVFEQSDAKVLGHGITGTWHDLEDRGLVRYLAGTKAWTLHVVLHELSHILLGHKGKPTDDPLPERYFTGMGQRRGIAWMCRDVDEEHPDEAEIAAENLAFGLAELLHVQPESLPTEAEQVFGL